MNADSTIDALALDFGPVRPARMQLAPIALGASLAACAVALFWGVRPGAFVGLQSPALWMKFGYTAALSAAALYLAHSLGKPGANYRHALLALVLPISIALVSSLLILTATDPIQRLPSLFGRTWSTCSISIFGLSLLTTPSVIVAARAFAPVQREGAAAAMGIAGGAIAATAYGLLYCAESSFVFIGVWYTLGIAAAGLAGAVCGRTCLRW
jgi:hypothetical protein